MGDWRHRGVGRVLRPAVPALSARSAAWGLREHGVFFRKSALRPEKNEPDLSISLGIFPENASAELADALAPLRREAQCHRFLHPCSSPALPAWGETGARKLVRRYLTYVTYNITLSKLQNAVLTGARCPGGAVQHRTGLQPQRRVHRRFVPVRRPVDGERLRSAAVCLHPGLRFQSFPHLRPPQHVERRRVPGDGLALPPVRAHLPAGGAGGDHHDGARRCGGRHGAV